ncbi:hypothetical protein F5H01DRAFT_321092 [Linnemannia elongata]|nr:hypothetical protein F5H01DRAFT_321092 [Linnemannia elongata]
MLVCNSCPTWDLLLLFETLILLRKLLSKETAAGDDVLTLSREKRAALEDGRSTVEVLCNAMSMSRAFVCHGFVHDTKAINKWFQLVKWFATPLWELSEGGPLLLFLLKYAGVERTQPRNEKEK